MARTPWWKSQYRDPVITEIMFGWETNTEAEVDQILKEMRLPAGAHILVSLDESRAFRAG
jgi:hypothetical protein